MQHADETTINSYYKTTKHNCILNSKKKNKIIKKIPL